MSPSLITWVELMTAAGAALWAGLLVLADEAPALPRALGDPPAPPRESVPLHRALQIARVALLTLAGVAAAAAVEWWRRPTGDAVASLVLGGALLYLVSDALPRGIGVLLPRLASGMVPTARRGLIAFAPLLGIASSMERLLQMLLPARTPTATSWRHCGARSVRACQCTRGISTA
jgi:hypothetical protein